MLVFLFVLLKKIKKKYKNFKEDLEWKSLGKPKKRIVMYSRKYIKQFFDDEDVDVRNIIHNMKTRSKNG